jgi:uncharacterized small protein (DUF1192 family)
MERRIGSLEHRLMELTAEIERLRARLTEG